MKAIAILTAAVFATVCLAQHEPEQVGQWVSRGEMARRLASLRVGMTAEEATAICGAGRIRLDESRKDHYSIEYGTVGDGDFGTVGAVYVEGDKVRQVRGGEGTVIDPTMFAEADLRSHLAGLQALETLGVACRPFKESVWLPSTLKFANMLRVLGKVRALSLLREYVRVGYGGGTVHEWDHVRLIARLLFTKKTRVEATIIPLIPRADDETILPHYPILYLEDLPLLAPLYVGFRSGGHSEFIELEKFDKVGEFITGPIRGPKNPFSAILRAADSPAWPSPKWWTIDRLYPQEVFDEDYAAYRDVVLCQVLSLCEGFAKEFELNASHEAWTAAVRHYENVFEESGYGWDAKKCMYVLQ